MVFDRIAFYLLDKYDINHETVEKGIRNAIARYALRRNWPENLTKEQHDAFYLVLIENLETLII